MFSAIRKSILVIFISVSCGLWADFDAQNTGAWDCIKKSGKKDTYRVKKQDGMYVLTEDGKPFPIELKIKNGVLQRKVFDIKFVVSKGELVVSKEGKLRYRECVKK